MKKKAIYQIILLKNNECIKTISSHFNLTRTRAKFNELIKENKDVIFPVKFLNEEKIEAVKYHLAIIKKKEASSVNYVPKFKNEFGQFIDNIIVDNSEWVMFEKEEYNFEESFWAYGYNPRFQRKDFLFIFREFIQKVANNKYEFLNIYYYKNKVLFETFSHMDMVICKNKDDAYRLYCLLDDFCSVAKMKYVMFSGDNSRNRKTSIETINKIEKLTNWSRKKIMRNTT